MKMKNVNIKITCGFRLKCLEGEVLTLVLILGKKKDGLGDLSFLLSKPEK